jgi:hypothetical protein
MGRRIATLGQLAEALQADPALSAGGGAVLLAMNGREIPDVLLAIGSGAVGALAGLLAPSPTGGVG